MTFKEALQRANEYGAKIDPIVPQANWVNLEGMFTPEMLRAIADEIERRHVKDDRQG